MECQVGDVAIHYVEHGAGLPVIVLHGAGVDHREAEGCFDPVFRAHGGLRRIYPDLPGMGRTRAPASVRSADAVLDALIGFADELTSPAPVLVVGHSAGAYYAQGLAGQRADRVAGLALVCPLLPDVRAVPDHHPVIAANSVGDEEFRAYFVVQTPEMLERYQRLVAPATRLADPVALGRIGEHWELTATGGTYSGATLLIAGRQDSTVGFAATTDLLDRYPRATLAVLDGAGHALPHEQPELLASLLHEWVGRSIREHGSLSWVARSRTEDHHAGLAAPGSELV